VKRIPSILFCAAAAALLVCGCSDAHYRRSADRQVDKILRDRMDPTLGYTPEVDTPVVADATPTKRAFENVPVTPKAPPTTAPIEPSEDVPFMFGPLGPEMLFPPGLAPPPDMYGLESNLLRAPDRLSLGPPSPLQQQVTRLDLFGALRYAVLNSRDYKSRMEDLYLTALDVTLERHLFSPRPFARTGVRYEGGGRNVDYDAALTATTAVGLRQRLPYGGEVIAEAAVDFVQAIRGNTENGENASVALAASLPLLRGAGLVNLESLIQSEREVIYEIRNYEDFRRDFALRVASDYFNLLADQQSISDRRANLVTLQQLTARSQALYANGRANFIDVQRALQEQLNAENQLVSAQARYRSSLDSFKLLLGMPVDEPLDVVPQELTVNIPDFSEQAVAELGLQYRLDLRTAQDRIEDAQRAVQVARNGLLPDLDLAARGTLSNNDEEPARRIDRDTLGYSAGATLELPVDRVAERNQYRASLIRLERVERTYTQLRDQVAADSREAMRLIRSAQISLEIQRKGIELAKFRLDNAYELLRLGRKDNREVVDAQNALLRAQDAFEDARATLQIQVLRFLRDTGTLRVDPDAGAIGAALDRRAVGQAADDRGRANESRNVR
jgi:outer membrane protein TolC